MRRGLIERRHRGPLSRSFFNFTSESPRADASPLFQVFFGSSVLIRQNLLESFFCGSANRDRRLAGEKDGAGRRVGEKKSQGEEMRKAPCARAVKRKRDYLIAKQSFLFRARLAANPVIKRFNALFSFRPANRHRAFKRRALESGAE